MFLKKLLLTAKHFENNPKLSKLLIENLLYIFLKNGISSTHNLQLINWKFEFITNRIKTFQNLLFAILHYVCKLRTDFWSYSITWLWVWPLRPSTLTYIFQTQPQQLVNTCIKKIFFHWSIFHYMYNCKRYHTIQKWKHLKSS